MGSLTIQNEEYKDFSRVLHGHAAEHAKVVNATIELTYGCNLRCVHCYTDCYNQPNLIKERELPSEEVIRILDELHDQGVLWVCFTGGEILMRRDFFEIYLYAKEKGFLITLFTNVTPITKRIADFLAAHRPFNIETSCHGVGETFDRITQVTGSFRRFEEGVRLLLERNLPVKVKTKAMTLNQHELDQTKAFVEGLGLKFQLSTNIFPRLDGDVAPAEYRLSPDKVLAVSEHFAQHCEHEACQTQPAVWEPAPPPDDRLYRCGCGTTKVHISAWGGLGPCTWSSEPRADLRRQSVAAGIGKVFPMIRNTRYEGDSPCRSCQVYTLCGKKPAIAGAEAGDPEQPVAHFCQVAYGRAEKQGFQAACPVPLRSSGPPVHEEM